MYSALKWRLLILGLAVGLMGALIVLVTLNSQRQGEAMRVKLNQVDAESFGLAEHFKDVLREASDKLTHYRNTRDTAAWQDYRNADSELAAWIQDQASKPATPREQEILRQMTSAFADYTQAVDGLRGKILALGPNESVPAELTDSVSLTRRRLFDLSQELSQAHLALKNQLLAEAHQTLTQLRLSVLGAVTLLFLFGIALAMMVYRDMIAPLRSTLKKTQAMVGQNEKLASLGLLAAGLAHEIRNPLTAVKAALFTQQKKFQAGSPELSDAKVVEREILRLERIVDDFLKFARPAEPEFKVIAADLLLMEARLLFEPQLAEKNIRVNQEPSALTRVNVDPAQIKQVLINLVKNAADSIGQDGTITLRVRQARKTLLHGEINSVILEVVDTGKGIPAEVEKRLFDPFFTTKENGTGLGLSIAARIMLKHGGVLEYQTRVNEGTTFGIVLPQVCV
jgi:signal transduction histidine kinase